MSTPAKTVNVGEAVTAKGVVPKVVMAVEGAALEVTSVEVPAKVPKFPMLPRPRPTLNKEGLENKKYKQTATPHPVCASPRKHSQRDKPTTQVKGKLVHLEPKKEVKEIPMGDEDIEMGVEDVYVEGYDPISKLPEYITPCRGKMKVPKYIEESKVTLHAPLLLDKIIVEGPHVGNISLLKLEDSDLDDTKHFLHLAANQLMHRVFHKNTGVTALELGKWLKGVDNAGPLNLLWVPHNNCVPITMIVIK